MKRFVPFVIVLSACATTPKSAPTAEDEGISEEEATALLDAPVEVPQRTATSDATRRGPMMILPETPSEPAKTIDGDPEDWKGARFRTFASRSSVETGENFWRGRRDASFRVSVDSDPGFLYFYVEVDDDTIVQSPMGEDASDGVVFWLRDPGLDSISRALPNSVGLDEYVDAETAVVIHPNGRVEPWSDDRPDFNEIMLHEVKERDGGYAVEVAFKLEAFEEISAIPLDEVAFRVEVIDGDEAGRWGWQSKLSTLPDDGTDGPRFATYAAGGMLPHIELGAGPPRTNAIGRWRVDDGTWNFVSFEVVPKVWTSLDDLSEIEAALPTSDVLRERCSSSRNDVEIVEAYQSRGGGFRSALVLCGERASERGCSRNADSNIYLVDLRPDPDDSSTWYVEEAIDIFDRELAQCAHAPRRGEEFHSHLALYPLDILSSTVWIVGWTRTRSEPGLEEEVYGVTLLNTKYDEPRLGSSVTRLRRSTPDERTIADSSVYLTYVNDDKGVDICQIEDVLEQGCNGMNQGCRTYERGRLVLSHIQMWSSKKRQFERYELTKHPNCTPRFDFSDADGYLVLQLKNRVGLLPSPRTNEGSDESDQLKLF